MVSISVNGYAPLDGGGAHPGSGPGRVSETDRKWSVHRPLFQYSSYMKRVRFCFNVQTGISH